MALLEYLFGPRGGDRDDDVLCELWIQTLSIPEWVDWDQIERGQKVVLLADPRVRD